MARRHLLATRSDDPVAVAGALVGLHATDPASVLMSATARMDPPDPSKLERALYEERSLVRLLGMRRTVFVVPVDLAAVVQSAATAEIAAKERRRIVQLVVLGGGCGRPRGMAGRRRRRDARGARRPGGGHRRRVCASDVPQLGVQIEVNRGKNYAGKVGMSTQVLLLLAAEGRIIRGRPRGTWLSTLYRWAPSETWIPGGIPEIAVDYARTELACAG